VSNPALVIFHGSDAGEGECYVFTNHDSDPKWVIPDLHRANRKMNRPRANCFGESSRIDLFKAGRAGYMAAHLIAENPMGYQPVADDRYVADFVYLVRPLLAQGGSISWTVEIRRETRDGIRLPGSRLLDTLIRRYPFRGHMTLSTPVYEVRVRQQFDTEIPAPRLLVYRGFLDEADALTTATLRHREHNLHTEVVELHPEHGTRTIITLSPKPETADANTRT
jgi:hypothetical protein